MDKGKLPIKVKVSSVQILTLFAIVFFILVLDHFSFWYDEQGTLIVINRSWMDLIKNDGDPRHPTLYYLSAKAWYQLGLLFKDIPSPYYLKIMPLFFGLSTYFIFLEKFKNSGQKLLFAIFYLSTPTIFIFFQEFRPYTMMVFFLMMAFLSFENGLSKRAFLCSLLALGTHYFSCIYLSTFLIFDFIRDKKSFDKFKLTLIPFITVGFYQLTKITTEIQNPIKTELEINSINFLIFFSKFIDPIESLPFAMAMTVSGFILGVIVFIELKAKTKRSSTDNTFLVITLLFWGISLITRDTYSSPRYLYPLLSYFPFYLVRRITEKKVLPIMLVFLTINLIVFFQPKWGLREFEHRPLYEKAFTVIKDNPKIRSVSICHRYKEVLPNHFFYYPAYLKLKAKVAVIDCFKEPFSLPEKDNVILISRHSPWWHEASQKGIPLLFKSRRLLIVKALPR